MGKMKKRILILTTLIILIPLCLSAYSDSVPLRVKATVEEDHGIVKPSEAVSLDRLVFEFEIETDMDTSALVETNGDLSIAELEDEGEFSIGLLYYGNQSEPYRGTVTVYSSFAWVKSSDLGEAIPLNVKLSIPEKLEQGIEVVETSPNALSFTVNPMGPRRGEKIASIDFSWDMGPDVLPGEYYTEINIGLSTI
jgi:hypothetical protein